MMAMFGTCGFENKHNQRDRDRDRDRDRRRGEGRRGALLQQHACLSANSLNRRPKRTATSDYSSNSVLPSSTGAMETADGRLTNDQRHLPYCHRTDRFVHTFSISANHNSTNSGTAEKPPPLQYPATASTTSYSVLSISLHLISLG